jgi:hypothetical protein
VQSFHGTDADLIRQNIISINNLNSQWKLFENTFFKSVIFVPYFIALMGVMKGETGQLLIEDFQQQLHSLVSSDTALFENQAVPTFIIGLRIADEQKSILFHQLLKISKDSYFNARELIDDLKYFENQ